ncbi:hypothetical protein [Shewanella livingstonensis]|uniref:Uncharacterized protein n=1 Tax=Shewanella livingstonensis TaxID=150120 RepID=A0A3G8LSZ0_9GAMM|nr:hypothetical protein [Shewanella livingstonensis]AZG71900.1 hypothetical protein EGC82_03450 [Shewanella livingstonensis]
MAKDGLEMSSEMALKTAIKKGAKKTIFKSVFLTAKSPACSVLSRAVEYSNAAGMNGQPVYAFNRVIKPLFTHSKKGVNKHKESLIPLHDKSEKRTFSRDLETAFLVLQDIAQIKENHATIVFGTVSFSINTKLKVNSSSNPALAYGKLLRERGWSEPTSIVLETGGKGSKTITHAHIITIVRETPESNLNRLKSLLKKDNPTSSSAVLVSPNYLFKQPYTELIKLEEGQFGALPTEEGVEHPYWLSSWREPESNEVKRRVPVNIASCDYLSKELSTQQAGKRYGFINFGNLRGMKVKERMQATRAFNAKYKSTSK